MAVAAGTSLGEEAFQMLDHEGKGFGFGHTTASTDGGGD
jgi:hypothetical protein